MNVLIIEDEATAARGLKKLLHKHDSSITVAACLDSVKSAVIWFNANYPPDLIFMDIQLADGLSFEIFKQTPIKTPVIFTTGYDQYAIKAFKVNSVDYLLKPIDEQALANSIKKYNELKAHYSKHNQSRIDSMIETISATFKDYKSRFLVKKGSKLSYIPTNEIAYFFSEDKVTFLKTYEDQKFIINNTLDHLDNLLNPDEFFRANRKFILAAESIHNFESYFKGRLAVYVNPKSDELIIVSQEKASLFKGWLDR